MVSVSSGPSKVAPAPTAVPLFHLVSPRFSSFFVVSRAFPLRSASIFGSSPPSSSKSKPSNVKGLSLKSQLGLRRGAPSRAAYCRVLKWAICAIELLRTGLLFHR